MTDTSIQIENLSIQEKVMIHIEDVSSDKEENNNNNENIDENKQIEVEEEEEIEKELEEINSEENVNSNNENNNTNTFTTTNKIKPPIPPNSNKPAYLSTQKPNIETSWSDLKSKMNQMDKSDLKRGSILIEHLSEYNKLASSQVILGEEEIHDGTLSNNSSGNNTPSINSSNNNNNNNNNNNSNSNSNSNNNNNNNNNINSSSSNTPEIQEPLPIINNSKLSQDAIDSIVMAGVNLFNDKPKKGVDYFIQNKFLEKTPESVSEFLHECPLLNKKSIGDYLGDIDPFCISTLESLISRFNFKDLDFDMSLRQLLYTFRLPGEAQKIDRIVQRFANQYYKDNMSSGFADPDTVYTLAFAIILLNTDLHNPVVKPTMTKPKFVKSLSKINSGKDLPSEFLEDMYDRILVDEIKMNPSGTLFPYAVKKGWLNIRVKGKVTDKWSRKWCVLSDGTLYFFRKPTDQTPVRYLRPDTVITSKKEIKGKKNCFILNHSSPPITLETLLKSTQKNGGSNGNSFNPQALLQQLAQFGKEQKKEVRFWNSATEKFGGDNKFELLQQEVLDTDSVSSLDTLSETSSATNYFEDELSPSSSVSSTSPMSYDQNYDPSKKGFLRTNNSNGKNGGKDFIEVEGKLKNLGNGTQTLHRPPPSKHNIYNPNFNTINPTLNQPHPQSLQSPSQHQSPSLHSPSPQPSPSQQSSNQPNQPKPNYFKTVSSSSLIRSSSISTFSTPNSVSSNNSLNSSSSSVTSNQNSNNSPSSSGIASTTTTPSLSTPNSVSSSSSSSSSRPHTPQQKSEKDKQYEKNLESFLKLQEKMIKASKNTNTCIINADTQREMNSWIRLITSKK